MRNTLVSCCLAALAVAGLAACTGQISAPTSASGNTASNDAAGVPADSWLQGSVDERLQTVADQLGGFGATMIEVGHRYGELYFAGQDRNWGYAGHQIEEIEVAMELGLQRRPSRAANAAMLDPALEAVETAIDARDAAAFDSAFAHLTATCNACHLAEDVRFIHVVTPTHRTSAIRAYPHGDVDGDGRDDS